MSHFMEINLIGSSDPRRDVTNIGVCIWARALADPLDLIRLTSTTGRPVFVLTLAPAFNSAVDLRPLQK